MTFKEMAIRMWPAWMMGLTMLYLVKNSKYANILKVDKKGLLNFGRWLAVITIIRWIAFKFLAPIPVSAEAREMAYYIPWQATLGVFWEDMCHGAPLVIASKMLSKEKWYKYVRYPLLGLVMFSFASGHLYQGVTSAAVISLYIPFTMNLAKKYGFGTIMLSHMLYDLVTILSFRWMLGS